MICAGDELGRTQAGNNNAYCQDNELSWVDWAHPDIEFLEFCRGLIRFRREHPIFRRRRFFEGQPIFGTDLADISWFRPDGGEMAPQDWHASFAKSIAVFLNGDALPDPDRRGQRVCDSTFLMLFNAHVASVAFTLPEGRWGKRWICDLDTATARTDVISGAGETVVVDGHSVKVLRRIERA
jgi:glycogen operon protein